MDPVDRTGTKVTYHVREADVDWTSGRYSQSHGFDTAEEAFYYAGLQVGEHEVVRQTLTREVVTR